MKAAFGIRLSRREIRFWPRLRQTPLPSFSRSAAPRRAAAGAGWRDVYVFGRATIMTDGRGRTDADGRTVGRSVGRLCTPDTRQRTRTHAHGPSAVPRSPPPLARLPACFSPPGCSEGPISKSRSRSSTTFSHFNTHCPDLVSIVPNILNTFS